MEHKTGAIIIEGHVQGLANTRALGQAGIPVIVVDKSNCIARYSRYCEKFFFCPDFQTDEFADFLMELAVKENLDGWVLIPSNDHAVYAISKNLERITKQYKTTIPGLDTIEKIYNKANLLALAEQLQVPMPRTWYFSNVEESFDQIPWPVLTKGKTGLSFYKSLKRKAFLANNAEELRQQLTEIQEKLSLENTFTQELIPYDGSNKTISFTAFCDKGVIKTYWMGVKLREHPLQFGTATFTESVDLEDCLANAGKLLKELKYTGVCEVEFLKDPRDGEYKLIEINARTWLWVGHAVSCGINFPLYIYQYLNDLPIIFPEKYLLGLKWRNPFSDLIYTTIALLKRKTTLKRILLENKGNKVDALFLKEDMAPFFRYGLMMFKFLKTR